MSVSQPQTTAEAKAADKPSEDTRDELDSLFEGSVNEDESRSSNGNQKLPENEGTTAETPNSSKESPSKQEIEGNSCAKATLKKTKPANELQHDANEKRNSHAATGPAEALEPASEKIPPGLKNYWRACFANASLQCLFGVPELAARYESFGFPTVKLHRT